MVTVIIAAALALAGAFQGGEPEAPASPEEIVAYHDSGEWKRDTTRVVRRARRFLTRRLGDRTRRPPAIVLDVDDTALSSYRCLKRVDFDRKRASCGKSGDMPAIPQTLRLYRFARRRDVAVFFVTGRRRELRRPTVTNLRAEGFTGRWRLFMRPNRERPGTHDGYKARTRRRIARHHRIVVNLGDQRSDLDGGHALRRFKLPNPMYLIEEA